MSSNFLGQITVYPYNFAPRGWADCAGQLLPISQNTALFSLLGTQFGGNGTSNFGLPNLQGRVAIGQGQGPGLEPYDMGEMVGDENVTLLANQAGHTHGLGATSVHGTSNAGTNNILATPQAGNPRNPDVGAIYNAAPPDTILVPTSIGQAGGNQPHNNIQPSLVLRYCIALQGAFPPRS